MKRSSQVLSMIVLLICMSGAAFSCNNSSRNASVATNNDGIPKEAAVRESPNAENSGSAARPGEWPAFHGSDRSNKSVETGLLKAWPAGGPELLQTITGLGEGYSSVSIAEGLIFTSGTFDNKTYVFAFDLAGKPVWKMPNGSAWKVEVSWAKGYDGPRSTPTYDKGIVYHQSELNKLTAYKASTGEVV